MIKFKERFLYKSINKLCCFLSVLLLCSGNQLRGGTIASKKALSEEVCDFITVIAAFFGLGTACLLTISGD